MKRKFDEVDQSNTSGSNDNSPGSKSPDSSLANGAANPPARPSTPIQSATVSVADLQRMNHLLSLLPFAPECPPAPILGSTRRLPDQIGTNVQTSVQTPFISSQQVQWRINGDITAFFGGADRDDDEDNDSSYSNESDRSDRMNLDNP